MARPRYVFIDAETMPIRPRPEYPPRSVGYAVNNKYFAFGHDSDNNSTRREAVNYIKGLLKEGRIPVFHNADFDLEVLLQDGVRVREFHDTMRLAFLNDPDARGLGLKVQAEQYCGIAPDERDMLREWVLEHVPGAKKNKRKWGEHIHKAPGKLVGVYAVGDTKRTELLFKKFRQDVFDRGMEEAYRREIALVPIKLDMERHGIKVRLTKLKRDIKHYEYMHKMLSEKIRRRLRAGKNFNLDSSQQLADALIARGLLSKVVRTKPSKTHPEGQVSTRRDVLEANCTDKKLSQMLSVYGVLEKYLSGFMYKWIEIGERCDGYIHPTFNTTRSANEFDTSVFGTRTGRFSSSNPNFQNVPNSVEESQNAATLMLLRDWMQRETGFRFIGLRDYFEPDDGCVFIRRDYNQQELRILAHFAEGEFLQMYLNNPRTDAHEAVRQLIYRSVGVLYPRKHVKITNFGLLYGMGMGKLTARLEVDRQSAQALRAAVLEAVPGIKSLNKYLRRLARKGEPFYTWGGREYYCEPPKIVETDNGMEKRTFEYKMLNTLIQGSAADCTKAGMINVAERLSYGRIVLQVHDELLVSVPRKHAKRVNEEMREAMEDVEFKLPMITDGEVATTSWARMVKEDKVKWSRL